MLISAVSFVCIKKLPSLPAILSVLLAIEYSQTAAFHCALIFQFISLIQKQFQSSAYLLPNGLYTHCRSTFSSHANVERRDRN